MRPLEDLRNQSVVPAVGNPAGTRRERSPALALVWMICVAPLTWAQRSDVREDVVELQDGSRVEGRVVFESDAKVVVRVGSRERELERGKVKNVSSVARSLRMALEQWGKIEDDDPVRTLDLARFCRGRGLEGEANVLAHRVLARAPENEEAHAFLGHEKRKDGWAVRDGKKRYLFAELGDVRKDWGEAWEFETTHYRLRTNLSLASACDMALELELFYREFFALFGTDLELFEIVKPMECQVHADRGSFPEASGRIAYFDPECNVLFELAVSGYVLDVLLHEATHQILHNTTAETRGGLGEVPGWLHEGLAEYMSNCRVGAPAHASYDERQRSTRHFASHREAKSPYDLGRILTLSAGDFSSSSKSDLKYAQSYTLVHFCLHGESAAHRPGFQEFLRRVYRGKGSSSDFKSALGLEEREFEKAWTEYVKSGG